MAKKKGALREVLGILVGKAGKPARQEYFGAAAEFLTNRETRREAFREVREEGFLPGKKKKLVGGVRKR